MTPLLTWLFSIVDTDICLGWCSFKKWVNSRHVFHIIDAWMPLSDSLLNSRLWMPVIQLPTLTTQYSLQPSSLTPHFYKISAGYLVVHLCWSPEKKCNWNLLLLLLNKLGVTILQLEWISSSNYCFLKTSITTVHQYTDLQGAAIDLPLETCLSGNKDKWSLLFLEMAFIVDL